MPDSLLIRRAVRHDLRRLGVLGGTLVSLHHGFDPKRFMNPGHVEAGYAHFLGQQLLRDDAVVLVAEEAGEIIGYLYGALEPVSWEDLREPCGYVHDIIVDERMRRRGAASRLMAAAADWFRERGMPRVVLQTAEGNAAAQALFARLGYRRTMVEMTVELDATGGGG
jgi:ribosomal protein S18 acetylase RimI-like enzyme